MNYLEAFDEIVDIMHNDYSGCKDKRGCDNPDIFRQEILSLISKKSINKGKFHDIVEKYLLAFKDYHVSFAVKSVKNPLIKENSTI